MAKKLSTSSPTRGFISVGLLLIVVLLAGCGNNLVRDRVTVPAALTEAPHRPSLEANPSDVAVALYMIDMELFADKLLARLATIAEYYGDNDGK